ncbi:hypothetical protein SNK05_011048 [Fusarium graminearum]
MRLYKLVYLAFKCQFPGKKPTYCPSRIDKAHPSASSIPQLTGSGVASSAAVGNTKHRPAARVQVHAIQPTPSTGLMSWIYSPPRLHTKR